MLAGGRYVDSLGILTMSVSRPPLRCARRFKMRYVSFKQAMEMQKYKFALAKYDVTPRYMSSAGCLKFAQEIFKQKSIG